MLLVANLTCAVGLLVSSVCISEPLKLYALPTILLVSTLFRLALNVSSTRLILSHGHAGQVIEAFGKVVLQGSIVVGLVVFLVISLVQFLVIAKGAERVAEVSARFTLDALPGKQMSIDADVRAGLIDFGAARTKRHDLQLESKFYGALDGAMKFVKGDAIAGLVIIVVNIIGGFIAGCLLQGRSVADSLTTFTVLSVGDGLVAQIPALLNAVSAGLVVTRVSRDDQRTLGADIVTQVLPQRSARILLGVFCTGMGVLPGMPLLPPLVLGLPLIVSGFFPQREREEEALQHEITPFKALPPPPIGIKCGGDIMGVLREDKRSRGFADDFQRRVFTKCGVPLTVPVVELLDSGTGIIISIRGSKVCTVQELDGDIYELMMEHLVASVQHHLVELIDDVVTRRILDTCEQTMPELVAAAVPGVVSLTQCTELIRDLIREHVSVENIDVILQAIAEQRGKNLSATDMLTVVRRALKRIIITPLLNERNTLIVHGLDPALDMLIAHTGRRAMPQDDVARYITELVELIHRDSSCTVLVSSHQSRTLVRELLIARGVRITVIAYDEIPEDTAVELVRVLLNNNVGGEDVLTQIAA